MNKVYWIWAAAPLLCLHSVSGQAASAETEQIVMPQMDTVVVTATKSEKKLENIPAVVNVITAEEIAVMPGRTVGDLLADLPGISAHEPQGVGVVTPQSQTISGNGFPGATLILLDGQKINTPMTDYAYLTTVPVHAVERIEVIRGPFSSLYGSSAGGGIINVITKDGGKEGNYVRPWTQAGSFGRSDYGLDMGLNREKFSFGLFIDHKQVDNYYLYEDQGLDDRNLDYEHDRFHAKLTGTLSDSTSFSLSGGTISGQTGNGLSDHIGLENHQDMEHPYINGQLFTQINDQLDMKLQLDWLRVVHEYHGETLEKVSYPPFGPPRPMFSYKQSLNDSSSDRWRGDLSANYQLNENSILTVGSELVSTSAEKAIYAADGSLLDVQGRPGTKVDEDDSLASLYLQQDWIWDSLELVVGARYDNYESYGSELSPKGSLSWAYSDSGNLKFSVGKGFKAPNLSQLYSPPWSISPFIVYQGNPDLEAETLWSYQVSLEQQLADRRFSFRITPYFTDADNFITSVRMPDPINRGGQIMTPKNVDEVEIMGADAEFNYRPLNNLQFFLSYNYNETRDAKTDDILDGYPRNNAALGLRTRHRLADTWNLSGSYAIRYRGEYTSTSWGAPPITETVGDYWYHTLRAVLDWNDTLSFTLDLSNLFDERARTDLDKYLPEFNCLAGASYTYRF